MKFLIFVIIWVASLTFVSEAYAVACSGVPISGNYTVSSSCEYSGTVDGVDAGTGTSNTANITVNSGQTLTISAGQTTVFGGSITINGSISIVNTGQIRQTALWMTDADADNYPSSTTQVAQSTTPTDGRRRNLMTSISSTDCSEATANVYQNVASTATDADQDGYYTGASGTNCVGNSSTVSARTYYVATGGSSTWLATGGALGTSDCNDSSATAWRNRYADTDADTYGVSTATCVGNDAGYIDDNTDCCDSDANAKPGQTAYFTTARVTCGGYDYDCDVVETKNSAYDCQAVGNFGSAPCPATNPHSGYVTSVAVPACGASGTWIKVYDTLASNCTNSLVSTLSTSCSNILSGNTTSLSANNVTQTMECR